MSPPQSHVYQTTPAYTQASQAAAPPAAYADTTAYTQQPPAAAPTTAYAYPQQTAQQIPTQPVAPTAAAPAAPVAYAAPVQQPADDFNAYAGAYDTATDYYAADTSVTDTTPDVSLTLEALEAELGSLDVDYDVDELLREYGIDSDSSN